MIQLTSQRIESYESQQQPALELRKKCLELTGNYFEILSVDVLKKLENVLSRHFAEVAKINAICYDGNVKGTFLILVPNYSTIDNDPFLLNKQEFKIFINNLTTELEKEFDEIRNVKVADDDVEELNVFILEVDVKDYRD